MTGLVVNGMACQSLISAFIIVYLWLPSTAWDIRSIRSFLGVWLSVLTSVPRSKIFLVRVVMYVRSYVNVGVPASSTSLSMVVSSLQNCPEELRTKT